MLITTPVLALALLALRRAPREIEVAGAALSCLLVMSLLALYYNTGWRQFGYRFSLDFIVPAFVLVAFGSDRTRSWVVATLVLAGIAINVWGVRWWFS